MISKKILTNVKKFRPSTAILRGPKLILKLDFLQVVQYQYLK